MTVGFGLGGSTALEREGPKPVLRAARIIVATAAGSASADGPAPLTSAERRAPQHDCPGAAVFVKDSGRGWMAPLGGRRSRPIECDFMRCLMGGGRGKETPKKTPSFGLSSQGGSPARALSWG